MNKTPIQKAIELAEEGSDTGHRPNWWWKQKLSELLRDENKIPGDIIFMMDKLGISREKQQEVFQNFTDFKIGITTNSIAEEFGYWADNSDNITDYID